MIHKMDFICLNGYATCCNIINDTLGLIVSLVAFILYLPLMPFVCIASMCTAKPPEDPETDALIGDDEMIRRIQRLRL